MNITINKKSWHYRWFKYLANKWHYFSEPKSVCNYFWGFVWINLKLFVVSIALVALIVMVSMPIWVTIGTYFTQVDKGLLEATIAITIVECLFVFLFLGSELKDKLERKYSKFKYSTENDTGFIKVTISTFKAFKNKVCPMIKYTEE